MARKPLTPRTALIVMGALSNGSLAGTLATTVAAHAGYDLSGLGQVTTALVTLWTLDKLHALIGEDR